MTLRHGVILLPEHRWSHARRQWTLAEELGFDHAWTYDHLMWRWLRDEPWFGTVPTLTAAATVTSRIRLGTMVASPDFRHPVTFAKEIMTLDDVSDGRLICGLGAGAGGYDGDILGQRHLSPRERADRFAEFVELTDLLLREPETSYDGRYFTSRKACMHPGCLQRPRVPFAIAATGPRGMRLAARHADIWVTAGAPGWPPPVRYDQAAPLIRTQMSEVDKSCAEIGRDPSTLRRLVVTGAMISGVLDSVESYQDASQMFETMGITDLVTHWPRKSFPYESRMDVLEEIAAAVLPSAG